MVDFGNFGRMDPEVIGTTRALIDEAVECGSPFLSFMMSWMAFNGWMESVTSADSDAAMINSIAHEPRMVEAYEGLRLSQALFDQRVSVFSSLWPIVSVRDVRRRIGPDAFRQLDRPELLEECRRHGVRLQPVAWDQDGPPTWEQLLRTIYLIRCNLFHGAKSPRNSRDRDLVQLADWILRAFIQQCDCFGWAGDGGREPPPRPRR